MTVYAKCVYIKDGATANAYTLNKLYEVSVPPEINPVNWDFTIIEDSGGLLGCMWNGDCDCEWARVEYDGPLPDKVVNPIEAAFRAGYLAACDETEYDSDAAWDDYNLKQQIEGLS